MGCSARFFVHPLRSQPLRAVTAAALLLVALITGKVAHAQAPAELPSFAELQAAGATVGEIRVLPQPIFDTVSYKQLTLPTNYSV